MARYIDADKMREKWLYNGENEFVYDTNAILDSIDEQPTADVVEVKHGKWDDNIIGFCNVCSECGAIIERTAIKNNSGALNYCSNCGAKMDGRSDTDDR